MGILCMCILVNNMHIILLFGGKDNIEHLRLSTAHFAKSSSVGECDLRMTIAPWIQPQKKWRTRWKSIVLILFFAMGTGLMMYGIAHVITPYFSQEEGIANVQEEETEKKGFLQNAKQQWITITEKGQEQAIALWKTTKKIGGTVKKQSTLVWKTVSTAFEYKPPSPNEQEEPEEKEVVVEKSAEPPRSALTLRDEIESSPPPQRKILSTSADLDGDGDKDTIKVESENDQIVWYERIPGNAQGTRHVIAGETREIASIYAKDVDNDENIDIEIWTDGGLRIWYENDGATPPGWIGHID